MKKITTPLKENQIRSLRAGEQVSLSGIVYTARDQAHKRLLEKGGKGPSWKGQLIYYCGPTRRPKGKIIGSCGPTTSSRMDSFTPGLLAQGLKGMIGKGQRSKEVIAAIKKYKAVYFLTFSGCGALLSKYVRKATPVAYKDLGPEAILKLEVKDFPLMVGIDSFGRNVYAKTGW